MSAPAPHPVDAIIRARAEARELIAHLQQEIARLESENALLRAKLAVPTLTPPTPGTDSDESTKLLH